MKKKFGVLTNNLLRMGIGHHLPEQNRFHLFAKNIVVISLLASLFLFTCLAIVFVSKLSAKFGFFFIAVTCLFSIVTYLHIFHQEPKLFALINELETTIEQCKLPKLVCKSFGLICSCFSGITHPITAQNFEKRNNSIEKWHSRALKFPAC